MLAKEDRIHYSRNLKAASIISLSFTISAFCFFPVINYYKNEIPVYTEPVFTVVDIPVTEQNNNIPSAPPRPEIIIPAEIIEIEEMAFLPDVSLSNNSGASESKRDSDTKAGEGSYRSLPFIPRQIIEVVPKNIEGASGEIVLILTINNEGYVKNYKIKKDQSNKKECLDNVIQAVQKSRWQPVVIDGSAVEYTIEKSYIFN